MASYLITGASRGLGFEFLRQTSQDPQNVVIGLVRDKKTTEEKIKQELKHHGNVHIIQVDLVKYEAIKESFSQVSQITGGKLDYIIANAALVSSWSEYDPLGKLGNNPARLEEDLVDSFKVNVVGNIHLFNVFMPLVLKSNIKKVVTISTGLADLDLTNKFQVKNGGPYTISKSATNMAVAKFNAEYAKDGVLFISISPGLVDTGKMTELTEEQAAGLKEMGEKFAQYAPHFKGPITPAESVSLVLSVVDKASVENGDGGTFVSHFGNKQWL